MRRVAEASRSPASAVPLDAHLSLGKLMGSDICDEFQLCHISGYITYLGKLKKKKLFIYQIFVALLLRDEPVGN